MANGEIHTVTISASGTTADGALFWAFRAPAAVSGGGARVVAAAAQNGATHGAGTAIALTLLRYSAAGTPALNGTIGAKIAGTADPFTVSIPKPFTINDTYSYLSPGEWAVFKYSEEGVATDPLGLTMTVQYQMGK